jgi:hypothetical protein
MSRRFVVSWLACIASIVFILVPVIEAKCAYPTLVLSRTKGEPGSSLTVKGESFWLRCIDEGTPPLPQMQPAKKIRILLKQGDQSIALATVDADQNLRFSIAVIIPANAALGNASIIAEADTYRRYSPTAFGSIETIQPVPFEVVASDRQ